MDQFVHAQNLLRYLDLLVNEADADRRARIQTLLLEEVGRSKNARERIAEADGLIAGVKAHIRRQQSSADQLSVARDAAAQARSLLEGMEQTLELLLRYRSSLNSRSD